MLKDGTRTAAVGHLLQETHPGAHLRAQHQILRHQAHRRVSFVEIFADYAEIDDDIAVVDQSRHHAIRIDRQIFGLEMVLGLAEVELDVLERQALFREADADLLTAGGMRSIVEREHFRLSVVIPGSAPKGRAGPESIINALGLWIPGSPHAAKLRRLRKLACVGAPE